MTHVLTIDGRQFSDGKAVHRMLKKLLCLPDYYGGNADALYDVLDERSERIDCHWAGRIRRKRCEKWRAWCKTSAAW